MSGKRISRREFLKTAAVAGGVAAGSSLLPTYVASAAPRRQTSGTVDVGLLNMLTGFGSIHAPHVLHAMQLAVQETDRWYLDYAAGLSAEQLAERLRFRFVDGDAGCMSREEILAHIVTHGGYHRGAVGRIMAQLQLAPPRDIYTRFLHEDQPQRREPG